MYGCVFKGGGEAPVPSDFRFLPKVLFVGLSTASEM